MIMIGEEVITEEEVNKILEKLKEKYSNLSPLLNEDFSFNKVLINNTKKRYDSCIPLKL